MKHLNKIIINFILNSIFAKTKQNKTAIAKSSRKYPSAFQLNFVS